RRVGLLRLGSRSKLRDEAGPARLPPSRLEDEPTRKKRQRQEAEDDAGDAEAEEEKEQPPKDQQDRDADEIAALSGRDESGAAGRRGAEAVGRGRPDLAARDHLTGVSSA